MGSATRHRQAFLKQNSQCAFCGGAVRATTIEHCPPRSMFQERKWPEGFEFPACERCNSGTSDHDLLIAFLARSDPFEDKGNQDGALNGLVVQVNRQFPGLLGKMILSASDARKANREVGVTPDSGMTHQDTGVVNLPDEFHNAVCSFAKKLTKAIFYKEMGYVFPNEGCLALVWFSNADLIRDGKYIMFEILKDIGGVTPALKRTGKYLNDQFEYKWSIANDAPLFVLQARFSNAFGLVIWGSQERGRLENKFDDLKKRTGRDGPFSIIQPTD